MENFDEPGTGRGAGVDSYSDNDADDHGAESNGGKSYREGTGVDIYKKATGYVVGYNQVDEWLEYTVNIAKAGDYTMYAAVASANATSGFKLSIDGDDITKTVSVPQATSGEDNYDDYSKVSADVTLPAGEHILRFTVMGDWMDIDYINFVNKGEADPDPIGGGTTGLNGSVAVMHASEMVRFDVFDLKGKLVANFKAHDAAEASALWQKMGSQKGAYGVSLIRNRATGAVSRVSVTK